MKYIRPKEAFLTIFLSTILSFTPLFPQTVISGWQEIATLASGDSLWGGWDIIVDLDLDNDGFKEFIFSRDPASSSFLANRNSGQTVYHYENTADNTFELRWSFQTPIPNQAGNVYSAITMGDLDDDGKPELYFGTPLAVSDDPPQPKGLYVFEFDGGTFPATPSERWGFGRPENHTFKCSGLAVGDVDGDGEQELVVQSRGDDGPPGSGGGRTMLVANSGGIDIGIGLGAFQVEFEESQTHIGGVVYDPRIVDFDGDGHEEIWVFTWDFFSLAIYESSSPNTYQLQAEIDEVFDPVDYGHRRGMRFYDANNDGNLEFFTAGIMPSNGANSQVFYIGSTADVSTLTAGDIIGLGGLGLPADGSTVGDIDGDNLMDFLFTARNGSDEGTTVHRMEYSGSGNLADSSSYEWSVFYDSEFSFSDLRNLAIADLDNDNKTEVYITRMNTLASEDPVLIVLEREAATALNSDDTPQLSGFALHQNYPNPFNPTTTISYRLERTDKVSLAIYDILGNRVRMLVNSRQSAGSYQLIWNGRNDAGQLVTSGEYFYVLETENFRESKKMSLIR